MTSKERIIAALEGQPLDYVPFCPFLAYVWEHFPKPVQMKGQLAFLKSVGADYLWRGAACPTYPHMPPEVKWVNKQDGPRTHVEIQTPVGTLRYMQMASETGNTNFLVEHPLKTEEDFKILLWIEERASAKPNPDAVKQHFDNDGREGLSLGMLIPRGKSAYQNLIEHQVGTEELNYALIDFPDTVETLWKTMVQRNIEHVKLAIEMNLYDYYITWEDTGTQNYSPEQYDKYIGSEISQWCSILKAAGKKYIQHACGHMKAVLPKLHGQGTFAVESLSPPPTGNISLKDAREILGNRTGIIGGIEPTHFLNLSEKELVPYVEQVLADGAGGPFVMANSDSCPPGVTEQKFRIVADVTRNLKMH